MDFGISEFSLYLSKLILAHPFQKIQLVPWNCENGGRHWSNNRRSGRGCNGGRHWSNKRRSGRGCNEANSLIVWWSEMTWLFTTIPLIIFKIISWIYHFTLYYLNTSKKPKSHSENRFKSIKIIKIVEKVNNQNGA